MSESKTDALRRFREQKVSRKPVSIEALKSIAESKPEPGKKKAARKPATKTAKKKRGRKPGVKTKPKK